MISLLTHHVLTVGFKVLGAIYISHWGLPCRNGRLIINVVGITV